MSFDIGGTQVYSLDEVSMTLGVSPAQLRRCIRRGELLARKVGNHYFVTTPNLLAFLAGPKPPGPGGGAAAPAPEGEPAAPAEAAAGTAPGAEGHDPGHQGGSATRRRKRGQTSRTPRVLAAETTGAAPSGTVSVPEPEAPQASSATSGTAPPAAGAPTEPVPSTVPPPAQAEFHRSPEPAAPPPSDPPAETTPVAGPSRTIDPPATTPLTVTTAETPTQTPTELELPAVPATATPIEERPTVELPAVQAPEGASIPERPGVDLPAMPAEELAISERPTVELPSVPALEAPTERPTDEMPAVSTMAPTEPVVDTVPAAMADPIPLIEPPPAAGPAPSQDPATADGDASPPVPVADPAPQTTSALTDDAAPAPAPAQTAQIPPTMEPAPCSAAAKPPPVPDPGTVPPAPGAETETDLTAAGTALSHPPTPPAARAFESLEALFDMPEMSIEDPVVGAVAGDQVAEEPASPEDRRQRAAEATRRRHKARTGEEPPAQIGSLHEMLDAEGIDPPAAGIPGSAPATDTRFLVRSAEEPPAGSTLDAIDEGTPAGLEPPTVILPPTDPGVNEARHRLLLDTAQEGRIAQRARDDIVATVRSLPPEEQNGALAGPIGEQLVKLDRLIEEGVRAQRELGIAPPHDPEVSTAVSRRTTSASLHRPASSGSRRFKGPAGEEITVPPSWLPVTPEMAPEEPATSATPPPAPDRAMPKRRESLGGETWQEVGLPAPAAAEHPERPDTRRVERITLTLTDEERVLLAERQILEEMAIHEIMRSQQPTSQRAWEQGKERFFAPMRAKANRKLEDATPAPRRPGRD